MKILSSLAILITAVLLGVMTTKLLTNHPPDKEVANTSVMASEDRALKASNTRKRPGEGPEDDVTELTSPILTEAPTSEGSESSVSSSADTESEIESARRLREEIRNADSLPEERKFLNNSRRLSLSSAKQVFGTEEFNTSVQDLQEQAYDNPEAQDLSSTYENYLSQQLEGSGAHFSLDAFACGVRICMGQASTTSDHANWNSNGLYAFQDEGPRMYATLYESFESESGQLIYQFFFTTDPESSGIALRP